MIYMSTRMAAASHCARPRPRLTTVPPAEEVELWKKVSAGGTVVVALCFLNFLASEHQHFDKPPPFPYLRIRNKVRRHIGALTARPDGIHSHPSPPPPPPPPPAPPACGLPCTRHYIAQMVYSHVGDFCCDSRFRGVMAPRI
eukprot:COSAG01_NODE_3330_length_6246_cov_4.593298_8_plen_142_part_00